ncbi:MAG TPA: class I SAM-dependent methyltransferase [Vicinamibacterales bacterium]
MERRQRSDPWASGDHYEQYVGRWSRPVAREFLRWIDAPPALDWIDVGCGTGALTEAILAHAAPNSVKGVDPSPAYLEFARSRITNDRASFDAADARALPFEPATYHIAVAGLALNFVPQPAAAVGEMARVVRPGGLVATYVWDYAGKMELMRHFWDTAVALDPAAAALDEGRRFAFCRSGPLESLFIEAGLRNVAARAIDVPTRFQDFDDYWTPFLGGQGPAPGYAMSLTADRRDVLRERIRSSLPIADDGALHLIARAWAVRGQRTI